MRCWACGGCIAVLRALLALRLQAPPPGCFLGLRAAALGQSGLAGGEGGRRGAGVYRDRWGERVARGRMGGWGRTRGLCVCCCIDGVSAGFGEGRGVRCGGGDQVCIMVASGLCEALLANAGVLQGGRNDWARETASLGFGI